MVVMSGNKSDSTFLISVSISSFCLAVEGFTKVPDVMDSISFSIATYPLV